jgi:NAD+ diphosphatase
MKHAELVTFGGSGLDRAHDLRTGLVPLPGDRVVPIWRGKPLVRDAADGALTLAMVPPGHPALAVSDPPILIGRDPQGPLWAADLSAWVPVDADLAAIGAFHDPTEQRHPALGPDERFAELRAIMTRLGPRDAEIAATAKALTGWHETHRYCARCGSPTGQGMAGWQRDCPACGAHHFPRTDPVVIMLITNGDSLLLGRSPVWPQGMYSLLAGFVEPGETIEAAVRREVWEEAGVRVGPVGYLASQPWPFPSSLMLGCRGVAQSTSINLDPNELEDALWVPRARLMAILAGLDPVIRAPRSGAIASYLMRNWLADRLD